MESTWSTHELLLEYHGSGDRSARARAIEQNLPLVHALAWRFSRSGEHVDDLVQAGSIGLIKAVDGFRLDRGRDLGAYAVPTIVGELRRHLSHRPAPQRHSGSGVVVSSLDEDVVEAPSAESDLRRSEARVLLRGAFRALSRRERHVVVLRFYRDLTQQGIAEELGLSQAQVSRILTAALTKLRHALSEP